MNRPPSHRPPSHRPPFDGPIIDVVPVKPRQPYLRRRAWKDLLFLCVVVVLGVLAKQYLYRPPLTDYAKWKVRPHIVPHISLAPLQPGQTGLPPCLFIVSPKAASQPMATGKIADCLQLRPDGRQFDLYEVALLPSLIIPVKTDLYVSDTVPLAFTRTYVPLDNYSQSVQLFLRHVYDLYLTGHRKPYTDADWRLPDNQMVHFDRISAGTSYDDAVFEDASSDPAFASSRQNWNGWGWDLSLQDGATYLSPEAYNSKRPQQGSLVGIFDSAGNEVRLVRQQNGDLTEIDAPGGHWIKLSYEEGKIVQAADSSGRTAAYSYDDANRPAAVVYSAGGSVGYSYDSLNRLTAVQDLASNFLLQGHYDSGGLLEQVDLGAGASYGIRYSADRASKTVYADITGPDGQTQRVSIQVAANRTSYTVQPLATPPASPSKAPPASPAISSPYLQLPN